MNRGLRYFRTGFDYVFDLKDAVPHQFAEYFQTSKPIPIFQYNRRKDAAAIIIPLAHYHDYPGFNIPNFADPLTFRGKTAKIHWRGGLHGYIHGKQGRRLSTHGIVNDHTLNAEEKKLLLRGSLRFALCEQYRDADWADLGLTITWGRAPFPTPIDFVDALRKPAMPISAATQHRYILALDGYDGPSSTYWITNTNSLMMRQESDWQLFGDNYFLPWIHYVPIAADGADLLEKFVWCEAHLADCERMVENAKAAWSVLFHPSFFEARLRMIYEKYNAMMAPVYS
jgi:hypothetical protein